jgi:hypothetical protein
VVSATDSNVGNSAVDVLEPIVSGCGGRGFSLVGTAEIFELMALWFTFSALLKGAIKDNL